MIVYSSIDIVDKGRPCLVINRNNTWFLVMCGLDYACIHVEYNYFLHDLDVELSFSWCLIMLITITKNEIGQTTKYFPFLAYGNIFKGGESVLWCWWNSLSKGEAFSTHMHTTFLHNFILCSGYVFCTHIFGSFVDSSAFHFFFSKPWKFES